MEVAGPLAQTAQRGALGLAGQQERTVQLVCSALTAQAVALVVAAEQMTATLMMPALVAVAEAVAEREQPLAVLVVVQAHSQSACACRTHLRR